MGLGIAAIKLYLELYQRGILTEVQSVMDMGSQELHLTKVRFDELVRAAGISDYDDSVFSELDKWPESRGTSAGNFYRLLGIDEYRCIDLNGAYNAIRHDPMMDENEKEAIRDELFEGDHSWPFL